MNHPRKERTFVIVEDLASNKLFVKNMSTGPSKKVGKLFSEEPGFVQMIILFRPKLNYPR